MIGPQDALLDELLDELLEELDVPLFAAVLPNPPVVGAVEEDEPFAAGDVAELDDEFEERDVYPPGKSQNDEP